CAPGSSYGLVLRGDRPAAHCAWCAVARFERSAVGRRCATTATDQQQLVDPVDRDQAARQCEPSLQQQPERQKDVVGAPHLLYSPPRQRPYREVEGPAVAGLHPERGTTLE